MNLKVRFRNPVFIVQVVLAAFTPMLAYMGLTGADITTWKALGDMLAKAVSNPYVLGLVAVSVANALNDPTTSGITDSALVQSYTKPNPAKKKKKKKKQTNIQTIDEAENPPIEIGDEQ